MKRRDLLGAAALAMAASALAAAAFANRADGFGPAPVRTTAPTTASTVLERCRALGEASGRTPECLAAWAERRRQFFATQGVSTEDADQ